MFWSHSGFEHVDDREDPEAAAQRDLNGISALSVPVAHLVTIRSSIQKDIDMTVPTGLLVDLAHERQAEIRRHALGADQRALIRSARPRTLTARIVRRLTART